MEDPTQIPPFYPVAVITNGVVTGFAGIANQHWFDTEAAPDQVKADDTVMVGDTYTDGRFTRPATLPAEEATDV